MSASAALVTQKSGNSEANEAYLPKVSGKRG